MKANRPHEHYEALLMKKVDGLLNESERLELERHLSRCDECREELEDFLDVKEATDMMTNRILADADIEPLREGPRTRAVLGVGMVLFIAGMLVMMGYGYYVFWMDPTVSIVLKVGFGLLSVGTVVLFIYVLRVRLRGRKRDPYREVDL